MIDTGPSTSKHFGSSRVPRSAIREFDFNTQDFLRFTYLVREECPARYFRLHRAALKKLWVTGYEAGLIRDKPFFLEDYFPFE